jgi:hypothetical protein
MKKRLVMMICSTAVFQCAFAQYYYYNEKYLDKDLITEIGASAGAMSCVTDLSDIKSALKNINFSSGFYIGLMYQNVVGVRLEATWGKLRASDSVFKGNASNQRNLSFQSNIQEISLLAEFHPMMLMDHPEGPPLLSPYLMAGVGWFSFSPQAKLNGRIVDLQPLRLEGQGMTEYPTREPYKLSQANVPLGTGVKYELSPLFTVRGEFIYRILFTDYLDDVSTTYINPALFNKYLSPLNADDARALYSRGAEKNPGYTPSEGAVRGNPRKNDGYFSFNLKVGINLGRTRYR